MRVYSVEMRPAAAGDPDVALVKEGFSWAAFFFGPLWFLWHRLWVALILYIATNALIGIAMTVFEANELQQLFIVLAFTLLVGWHANDFRRWTLRRHGYVCRDIVAAHDLDEAERRLFEKLMGERALVR